MRIQSHANNIRGHSSFNQLEIEMCQSHGNTAPHASAYILFETDVFLLLRCVRLSIWKFTVFFSLY